MKRLLVIFVSVLLLLTLVLGCAFFIASRDSAPPDTSDLVLKRVDVADADNAFTHFQEAVKVLDWPEDEEHKDLIWDIIDDSKSDPQYVAELLSRNQKALKLLDRGLECAICQTPKYDLFDETTGNFYTHWRQLACLLALKGQHEQEAGRLTEAVETYDQLLHFADLIQRDSQCATQFLTGRTALGMALHKARQLASHQEITPEDLARLAESLACVTPPEQGVTLALKGEYWTAADVVDAMKEGKLDKDEQFGNPKARRWGYLFQPNRTKQIFADYYREGIENATRDYAGFDFPDCEELVGLRQNKIVYKYGPNTIGRAILAMMLMAQQQFMEVKCCLQGEIVGTRLIVACRRYEQDHGQLPPTLDALVPKYLDAVPRDPFDGKPIRYDKKRAIIYSVGKDLIDSAGSEKSLYSDESEGEYQRLWRVEDAVFHIHGRPKTDKQDEPKPSVGQAPPDKRTIEHAQSCQAQPDLLSHRRDLHDVQD